MNYHEYVGNMHIHTRYSDGTAWHAEIAHAAESAQLDFIITTDHNILVQDIAGYYGKVLLLTGEEIHDRSRQPSGSHCLVYGIPREMASYGHPEQLLLDTVRDSEGLSFLAHPYDPPVSWMPNMPGFHWQDWRVRGYTGIEIWNYMSEFKRHLQHPWDMRHLFRPENLIVAPNPAVLGQWDDLLSAGHKVVGIGGADAHATIVSKWFFQQTVFPYDYLFNCVNTHLLTNTPLAHDSDYDAKLLYRALEMGRAFISYGMLGSARGFRYTAQSGKGSGVVTMGATIRLEYGVTLQVLLPSRAHIKLIHRGKVVHEERDTQAISYSVSEKGAFRVEVWREFKGKERCWILSNPIYVQ